MIEVFIAFVITLILIGAYFAFKSDSADIVHPIAPMSFLIFFALMIVSFGGYVTGSGRVSDIIKKANSKIVLKVDNVKENSIQQVD
jgi:O-antigen/teichoic acid export membrane protein